MKYRDFGGTGIETSVLGFGAMRLPTVGEGEKVRADMDKAVPMLAKGLDSGINYIDTAWAYLNRTSEKAIGEAIAGRDRRNQPQNSALNAENALTSVRKRSPYPTG